MSWSTAYTRKMVKQATTFTDRGSEVMTIKVTRAPAGVVKVNGTPVYNGDKVTGEKKIAIIEAITAMVVWFGETSRAEPDKFTFADVEWQETTPEEQQWLAEHS
jgi:hypothetical protein